MGLDNRDETRRPEREPVRSGRRPATRLLGLDTGLLLGIALVGIGLAALLLKGFERSEPPNPYDTLAAYDSLYSSVYAPVDVNTATREELLLFRPWISERIADGIIERRPFRLVEELLEVKGVGEVNIEIISMYLYGFEDQPEPRPIKPPDIPDA